MRSAGWLHPRMLCLHFFYLVKAVPLEGWGPGGHPTGPSLGCPYCLGHLQPEALYGSPLGPGSLVINQVCWAE